MLGKIAEKEKQIEVLKREIEMLKAEHEYGIELDEWYEIANGKRFFKPKHINDDYVSGIDIYMNNEELAHNDEDAQLYLYGSSIQKMIKSTYNEMISAVNTHNVEILKKYR